MQWLAAICVRRPVFTWVLVLALAVIGFASYSGLGVDRFPKVELPMVVVTTLLPGASPEQVESEVTDKVEEAVNSIAGVDELRSVSYEGMSVVLVRFELEMDAQDAAQEVRDRVNRILATLPEDAEQPKIERMDPDAAPVMYIALSGKGTLRDLTEFATRKLRRQLESVSGVGGVAVLGGRARQIFILIDPLKLQGLGITVDDVNNALRANNIELPGGTLREGARSQQVRLLGRVQRVADFEDIEVAQKNGVAIRIRDLAKVEDGEEEAASLATLNGKPVVILAPRKQSGTNTVAVIEALKERVKEVSPLLPKGYKMKIVRDESEFISNALNSVKEHLFVGSIFAALVVLLFLWNGRSTLIAALAIPTSIISTFALIRAMNLTLNVITLLALTLSVGIVIDDAIVVLENIVRFIDEKRMNPRRAAVEATREIGLAVLATTLSLVAVFLPIAFMGGIVGRFMQSFGFTMSFAVMVSLFVAFTLTPMLCSRWLKPRRGESDDAAFAPAEEDDLVFKDPPPEPRAEEKARYREWLKGLVSVESTDHHDGRGAIYGRIENLYIKFLAWCMGHRWAVGMSLVLTFLSTVPLGGLVAKNFLPIDDESRFEINIRAPEGTSLEQTQLMAERVARKTRALAGVRDTVVTVGSPPGDASGRGPNQAAIYVALIPANQRTQDQQAIMANVRKEILQPLGTSVRAMVSLINAFGGNATDSAAIQYIVRGPDINQLAKYSDTLVNKLKKMKGVVDADTTLVFGRPERAARIDRDRAADLGVSAVSVGNALRTFVGGLEVTNFSEAGEQYEVYVRGLPEYRNDPTALYWLPLRTSKPGEGRENQYASLRDVVTFDDRLGPATINRLSRQRQVTVYANVGVGASESKIIADLVKEKDKLGMPKEYGADFVGRSKELGKANRSFMLAFGLSLVFMYLVLAAQFESWLHPVSILISLPLTVPFALLSLILLGQSMNIFSTLGILVLFGVVKKNAILQVDHTRELRRKGHSRADSVMIGNRDRLRPILMTTIAFVAGMLPLMISSGAGAGTNRAMASVIVGGQTLALVLTLIATPVVYTWLDDLSHWRARRQPSR